MDNVRFVEEPPDFAVKMLMLENSLYYPYLPKRKIGHYEFTGDNLTVTITHRLVVPADSVIRWLRSAIQIDDSQWNIPLPLLPVITKTWETEFGQWAATLIEATQWVQGQRKQNDGEIMAGKVMTVPDMQELEMIVNDRA